MSNWKRRGSVGICFWSLLLALLGISQLIFGAYYVSKLPVFKIGSPVWVGFLNILCATGLFGLHHQTLELRRYWCRNGPIVASASSAFVYGYGAGNAVEQGTGFGAATGRRKWPRLRRLGDALRLSGPGQPIGRLYASLCLSLVVVFVNLAHAVICEVGEWQHWLTVVERTQLRTAPLSQLALQAHHVTSAQVSGSIILGILCASFTVWLMYRYHREDRVTGLQATSAPRSVKTEKSTSGSGGAASSLNSEVGTATAASSAPSGMKKSPATSLDGASTLQISFDNPNWVYGESERVQLNPSGHGKAATPAGRDSPFLLMKTYRIPRASISVISDTVPMRHATIRRAPSIINSLPDNFSSMRDQLRSSSFRTVRSERPRAALVQRSQTFKETTFTGRSFESSLSFAQRFHPSQDSRDALSFVHDGREIREIRELRDTEEEVRQEEEKPTVEEEKQMKRVTSVQTSRSDLIEEEDEDQEEDERDEEEEPVRATRTVRNTDRIILRVESFRTLPPSIPSRYQMDRGSPVGSTPRPGQLSRVPTHRSAPRVSCSTQTELSSLKSSNSAGSAPVHDDRSLPSFHQAAPASGDKMAAQSGELQLSPVESSSGYSSPRGTESKSPTPEPFSGDGNATVSQGKALNNSTPSGDNVKPHINVTVIQIEPNRDTSRLASDTATYAVPRKRSERQLVPVMKPASPAGAPPPVGAFRVSIQSKTSAPVSRSVSFHHQQQHSSRKSVYNEWLYPYGHPQAQHPHHPPSMIPIPIPRPVLRTTSHRSTPPPNGANYGRRLALRDNSPGDHNMAKLGRSASTVGRSSSVHLAMSEIQRKLDLLQMVGANLPTGATSAPSGDLVPVHAPSSPHGMDPHGAYDPREAMYTLPSRSSASSGHRRKSRKSSNSPAALMAVSPVADLSDGADSAETLAYLSELEMLARYWRTQLMYKVEMKASSKRHHHGSSGRDSNGSSSHNHHLERDTFQC